MIHTYMTFPDNTKVTYSNLCEDRTIKIYFETPIDGGFHHAVCILPSYEWQDVQGYSKEKIDKYNDWMYANSSMIMNKLYEDEPDELTKTDIAIMMAETAAKEFFRNPELKRAYLERERELDEEKLRLKEDN